jgi:hypothetical protein
VPVGAEFFVDRKTGVSIEIGIPLLTTLQPRHWQNDVQLHSDIHLRIDIRHYFLSSRHIRMFLGGESFFRSIHFSDDGGYYRIGLNSGTEFTFAKGIRTEAGGGYLMGVMLKLTKRFFIEGMGSVGFKVVNGRFYDVEKPINIDIARLYGLDNGSRDMLYEGTAPELYASAALKVGFLFGQ